MELNQQVSTLQGEVKLLKGEIKSILKEVRTALLSRDNPFTADANPPTFHAVGRPEAGGPDDPSEDLGVQLESPEMPTQSLPAPAPEAPAPLATPAPEVPAPPPIAGPGLQPPQAPTMPPAAAPEGPSPLPTAEPGPQPPPAPASPYSGEQDEQGAAEPPAPRWSMLTIASLAAWAEDALATLGPKRFKIALELACFAEILAPEAKDVLCGVVQLAPAGKDEDRPMNINECLVVLRQLEAILQGEKITRFPRKRGARHTRVR